ncbi:MAG TPA: ATP-binding protein, partial [Pyrinomonadaceae bacterium]|nr:ATP-binding protein [Pyrinomonadaceae bacterium]
MDQTQREFLVDIEELVEHIFADLDELRATKTEGRQRRELVDRIFRRVHSVKGSAASCGLDVVSHIAHEFENLLDEVRSGRVRIDKDLVDTCESAADALSESLSLAASGSDEPSRRALFDRLQTAGRKTSEPQGKTETILKNIPFEIWESLTEPEKQRLVNVVGEGSPLFVVATSFDIENFDSQFFQLQGKLAEFGEVISIAPAVDDTRSDRINFRLLYSSDADAQAIEAAVIDFSNVVFTEISRMGRELDEGSSPLPSGSISSLSNFVRTDLDKLDQLISGTHELLRTTSTALELALAQPMTNAANAELQKLSEQIRSSFMSVEDDLINLRMVPAGPTFQRVMRAGRAAARLAAKEIDFEINGAEIRLDKLLIEAIADPLIHLVRNAVDHGIETPEERAQAGKQRRGTIRIEAISEGSQSRLRVTDDGRGVDPVQVSAAALRLGIAEAEALDIERSLRLIFRPGFTTLASVSDLSGRGVGLDVVETSVEQVGGELRVSSKFGEGT